MGECTVIVGQVPCVCRAEVFLGQQRKRGNVLRTKQTKKKKRVVFEFMEQSVGEWRTRSE